MPFSMEADSDAELYEKYDALQKVLSVDRPAELKFEGMPDRYCMAIPSGPLDFDQILETGEGTITWIVPDGLMHSVILKEFEAAVSSDGTLSVDIINNGTTEVPINFTIKHNGENGFVGIISDEGIIQIGKIEEADSETYKRDEVITSPSATRKIFNPAGWYPDTGELSWSQYVATNGTLGIVTVNDSTGLKMLTQGPDWGLAGGMWSHDVVDSNGDPGAVNFYAYADCWFELGKPGQTGAQVIAFADENNKMICAQVIYKLDEVGIIGAVEFCVADGKGGRRTVFERKFECASDITKNPYANEKAWSEMRKEGGNITFYNDTRYYTYYVPELVNVKVDKVQLFLGQYDQRGDTVPTYIARNHFRRIELKILGVEKWRDIPNRYQPGDEIYVDGEGRKIYVNGMNRTEDEVRGSTYFKAKPGKTRVEFTYSDFCESAPTITANIREAYL